MKLPSRLWSIHRFTRLNYSANRKELCDFSTRRYLNVNSQFVKISDEVQDAINLSKPVVALESAIYTHGFPYPENVALASRLESLVRVNGAVPASIGVIDGIARVGLDSQELLTLTTSAGQSTTRKVSRRDIAYVCGSANASRMLHGGTTVSATALLAHKAGIKIFATGGLGGVHRNGENTLDISADLTELGRTNITVISSGCKGFLDIPRTLEYLETQGVGVITLADGRQGPIDFPAFWSRESGVRSPSTVENEQEAAAIVFAHQNLNLGSGLLFANPVPQEHAIPGHRMDAIISQALEDANVASSRGSENTPFVLNRIREMTENGSVAANRALIESNVVCATKIARELAKIDQSFPKQVSNQGTSSCLSGPSSLSALLPLGSKLVLQDEKRSKEVIQTPAGEDRFHDVAVAGSIAMDLTCDFDAGNAGRSSHHFQLYTSNPVMVHEDIGGVGRNVATAMHYLGLRPRLCTVVGNDALGSLIIDRLRSQGISTSGIQRHQGGLATARYIALNSSDKQLHLAVADMRVLSAVDEDTASSYFKEWIDGSPQWTVVDANWSSRTIQKWLGTAKSVASKTALEPVSTVKARRLFDLPVGRSLKDSLPVWPHNIIDLATPNSVELRSMWDAAHDAGHLDRDDWFSIINDLGLTEAGTRSSLERLTSADLVDQGIPQQSIQLLPFMPCITVTMGSKGVLLTQLLRPDDERLKSPAAAPYILPSPVSPVSGGVYMRLFSPKANIATEDIISVNGVGDTFLGAIIAGLTRSGSGYVEDFIDFAQECAILTLKSEEAVSPELSLMKDRLFQI